ncbi:glycoside hydrolase superfamily [Pseudomassariella vexata]|uniref:chitinase n=1 Tax=Pseudomassariella vexata TaxID=1141098 RepID=A0A1Y2EFL9_9PEZI|nr:glycoside hydrolase superfamily [Pseudomassariella vexata]ORY70372.1 glycoside hydrolase superfamily [Pseudomassariella vexata]
MPCSSTDHAHSQHPIVPSLDLTSSINHVILAFMGCGTFNEEAPDPSWPLFMSVSETRSKFKPGTKVMVAIGGWGDTAFDDAARTEQSRQRFARNVKKMVDATGADGVDIDWEYPGGNGEDYKQVPNSERKWTIAAYPRLLAAVRTSIGPDKVISAAVPGIPRDMLAFTAETEPVIMQSVDFLNVMTYDLMNRRDNVTKHHTGLLNSLEAIDLYISNGAPPSKLNLGFAFYAKYFLLDPNHPESCAKGRGVVPGCPTGLMEDPETGADLGKTGGFSWHDHAKSPLPPIIETSYLKALSQGRYDNAEGGYFYFDQDESLWWTFDTPEAILKKFPAIVDLRKLGGVFAWGLGEDAPEFKHLKALNAGVDGMTGVRDEL